MKKYFLKSVIALSLLIVVFPSNAAMIINPSTGWSGNIWLNEGTSPNIWLTDSTTGFRYETRETHWGIYVDTDSIMSFRVQIPQGDHISISEDSLTIDGAPGSSPVRYIYYVGGFQTSGYVGDVYIGSYTTDSSEDGFYYERNTGEVLGNAEQFERFTNGIKNDEDYQYYSEMWSGPGGFEYDISLPAGYHSLAFAAGAVDDASGTAGVLASVEFSSAAPVPLPAAVWLFASGLLGLCGVRKVFG